MARPPATQTRSPVVAPGDSPAMCGIRVLPDAPYAQMPMRVLVEHPGSVRRQSPADTLIGNVLANKLIGDAGNDTISGLVGNDKLIGGPGTDSLNGGPGTDTCTTGEITTSCE